MTRLVNTPIPLEPRDGGALNWLEMADEQGQVTIEFLGDRWPSTPAARQAWLIKQLRDDSHQGFFFRNLAHKGLVLDFEFLDEQRVGAQDRAFTRGSVPLPQLFLLPNQDPATELGQLGEFLQWVDTQRQGVGRDGREATIQWFRGGYRDRGLEWAGVENEDVRKGLNVDLQKWRQKNWFEQWYQANMAGFAKFRAGPHCWLAMASLVPDRYWAKLLQTPARANPRCSP